MRFFTKGNVGVVVGVVGVFSGGACQGTDALMLKSKAGSDRMGNRASSYDYEAAKPMRMNSEAAAGLERAIRASQGEEAVLPPQLLKTVSSNGTLKIHNRGANKENTSGGAIGNMMKVISSLFVDEKARATDEFDNAEMIESIKLVERTDDGRIVYDKEFDDLLKKIPLVQGEVTIRLDGRRTLINGEKVFQDQAALRNELASELTTPGDYLLGTVSALNDDEYDQAIGEVKTYRQLHVYLERGVKGAVTFTPRPLTRYVKGIHKGHDTVMEALVTKVGEQA